MLLLPKDYIQVYSLDATEAMRAIFAFVVLLQLLVAHLFVHYFSIKTRVKSHSVLFLLGKEGTS